MRITKAIDDAEEAGDELVLIVLDTPGGLVTSMEKIVKRMLVRRGSDRRLGRAVGRQGGLGRFLPAHRGRRGRHGAGHAYRSGVARSTHGGDNKEGDVLLKKSNEDLAALIRSIADHRGRNVEACEKAVFEAKAYEEQVALEKGLIDLIAADREDLLNQLDGREIRRFDGTTVDVAHRGVEFRP